MERKYNEIYKKLVDGENDVFGHIAYSVYKSNKIEFIEKFKEEHGGRLPTDEELEPFNEVSCTPSSIDLYEMKAEAIVLDFVQEVVNNFKDDMEEDYIRNQNHHLESIIEPLKPMSNERQFWRGVVQSILGAFFFAIIVAAFIFITSYNKNDDSVKAGNYMEQFFEPQTQQSADTLLP